MRGKLTKEKLDLLEEAGYSKKAIELYESKVNIGVMNSPHVVFTYTGTCGDVIKLYLKIDENSIIEDTKFQCLGCPGAALSASAITKIAKGKTLEEAKKIRDDYLLKELEGLPVPKLDCPKLAVQTLRKAITKYNEKIHHENDSP
jgi:nitrogen fixation NifU-like protein